LTPKKTLRPNPHKGRRVSSLPVFRLFRFISICYLHAPLFGLCSFLTFNPHTKSLLIALDGIVSYFFWNYGIVCWTDFFFLKYRWDANHIILFAEGWPYSKLCSFTYYKIICGRVCMSNLFCSINVKLFLPM
jgi:hypothetical protein